MLHRGKFWKQLIKLHDSGNVIRKISIMHVKVQCLHAKMPLLRAFLEVSGPPEILCISEHWMNTTIACHYYLKLCKYYFL